MIHTGICHGTLGELIQGPFIRGSALHIGLVSLPLRRYSRVRFVGGHRCNVDTAFAGRPRCRHAIDLYLGRNGLRLLDGAWSCDSELAPGKGMASSTADIVATLRCLDSIFQRQTPPGELSAILKEIERSDSVFLDHYALYLSDAQEVVHHFGSQPRFHVCYVDEGGCIDTEQMGPVLMRHYALHRHSYGRMLDRTIGAFAAADAGAIARCATESALLSQEAHPKRCFEAMARQQQAFQADGIFVAHTGTLLGYLFRQPPGPLQMGELSSFFHGLGHACRFELTGF